MLALAWIQASIYSYALHGRMADYDSIVRIFSIRDAATVRIDRGFMVIGFKSIIIMYSCLNSRVVSHNSKNSDSLRSMIPMD